MLLLEVQLVQLAFHKEQVCTCEQLGVSTFSVEKLVELAPLVAGPPEVSMQGPPIRVIAGFLPP